MVTQSLHLSSHPDSRVIRNPDSQQENSFDRSVEVYDVKDLLRQIEAPLEVASEDLHHVGTRK
jgi:hypothetical protein